MKSLRHFLISSFFMLVLLLAVTGLYSQQAYVRVTDRKSHENISYANVCFEGLKNGSQKHFVTDMNGKVVNDVKEKTRIAISFIGYETIYDTLYPGKNLEIQLKPIMLNLQETVVTAQFTPERVDKSIYPVSVISSRQIEQKGATNLSDLLKSQLGMRVSQQGVLGTGINLQGLGGEHVKFLIDGVPMIGRMMNNIDLNQVNLNNVDHVEVIDGPTSVIYGSNAMAGVINIITKENKTSNLNANANAYYESIGVVNADASVSLRKNKNSFAIDGGRNFFQGYSFTDSTRSKIFKPRRQWFTDAYYLYSSANFKMKLSGQYFDELLVDKGDLMAPYFETAFDSYFTTLRYSGKLEMTKNLPDKQYLNMTASWSGYKRLKRTYFKDMTTLNEVLTSNPDDQDTTTMKSWMVRATFARSRPEKVLNFQTGLDLNNEEGAGKRILGNNQDIGDYAAFVSLKYDPLTWLSFQPGARAIYNTKYDAPFVYSMNVRFALLDNITLRTSYSRGYRSPAIKELYLDFVDVNHNVHGNPDLKAEYSNNMNFNLTFNNEHRHGMLNFELNGFLNQVQNGISLAQGAGTLYTYINIDQFRTKGLGLTVTASLYPFLNVKSGVTETGMYQILSTATGDQSEYFYSPDIYTEITYRLSKYNASISTFYKYTGKTSQYFITQNNVEQGYIADYHSMDISATKGFIRNSIRISTGIKNVFDNKVVNTVGSVSGVHGDGGDSAGVVDWGRTWFIKLAYVFNKIN